jgi:hypothetical protein
MLDLTDTDAVLLRLEHARRLFANDGPLVPAGYLFSGYSAQAREQLPPGVSELVIELAEAIADSGPSEVGLSAMAWLGARRLTNAAAASLGEGPPSASYGKAKQAVVVIHGMFESVARQRRGRPRWSDSVSTFAEGAISGLDEVAAELAPGERLLFACQTSTDSLVIAIDRKLLVADRAGGVPSLLWSNKYSNISSVTISRPLTLTVVPPFLVWRGHEMTISAGDREARLHFGDERDAATVIAGIWTDRRTKSER